ncbi:hypothetical protein ACVWV0_003236 [Ewingella americana]|jgi:hypothetical protein
MPFSPRLFWARDIKIVVFASTDINMSDNLGYAISNVILLEARLCR